MGMRMRVGVSFAMVFAGAVRMLMRVVMFVMMVLIMMMFTVMIMGMVVVVVIMPMLVRMSMDARGLVPGQSAAAIFTHYSISIEVSSISRPARKSPLSW